MDNFQIETAQNIRITQDVAGIWERILAYLIDALILLAYVILVILALGASDIPDSKRWVILSLLGLPLLLYFLLWEVLWNGQTPGKAVMKLRVVKIDGTRPSLSNYLVRWLLRTIDITICSGSVAVLTILINGKGQRLGDLAAGTTVISEKERIGLESTLLSEVPEDYKPVYPQVTLLSDRDVQEIKDIYHTSVKNSNYRVIASLSIKVSEILRVTPKTNASEFIRTVLSDYSYYTGQ